jgi:inner membrane protein
MDPISQAALGAVVAQTAGHKTLGFRVAVVGAAAAAMPDIDVFFSLGGDYFDQLVSHRGITHSLFFGPVVGPILGWLVWRVETARGDEAGGRRRLHVWMIALSLAIFSHPLLDFLTPYGTQLLLPFSNTRFAVSAMPIIDPVYTITLLVGLLIAARNPALATRVAGIALLVSSSYLGYGWYLNSAAEAEARAQLAARGVVDVEVAAFPTILQVHYRRVVARTADLDRVGFISMWNPCEIQWRSAARIDRSQLAAFLATREGSVFDWFAMGWAHYELATHGATRTLTATDLRYGFDADPTSSVFTAAADLDSHGVVAGPVRGGRFAPQPSGETLDRLAQSAFPADCGIEKGQIVRSQSSAVQPHRFAQADQNQIRHNRIEQLQAIEQVGESTGANHDRSVVLKRFFGDAVHHLFDHSDVAPEQAILDALDGCPANGGGHRHDFHRRQLGSFFLESIHRQAHPGNDIAAHEFAVAGNCTNGRRRTEVDDDEIAIRIKFDCADRVRNSIRPNLFGILIADAQPGLDTRAHDQRVEIEVFLTARSQRVKHVRHHRTDRYLPDLLRRNTIFAQRTTQEYAQFI